MSVFLKDKTKKKSNSINTRAVHKWYGLEIKRLKLIIKIEVLKINFKYLHKKYMLRSWLSNS